MQRTYISPGDFIDLYYKFKNKGLQFLVNRLRFSTTSRAISKWNEAESDTNFWIIPEVLNRWNEKMTGNPDLGYEKYFCQKYLQQKNELHLLSVGCGNGSRERNFATFPCFKTIEGIDFAEAQIIEARQRAEKENLNNIIYHTGDFIHFSFLQKKYDVILFNSSLHHFNHIEQLLTEKVIPLLKPYGYLIIFEYVGPDRLQWRNEQLEAANGLLNELPVKYKRRYNSSSIKRKIYRPGWIRMLINDPSEAVASTSILPAIHRHFRIIEEKKVGWDLTHILFKDIAQNFVNEDKETKELINYIFRKEDEYLNQTGYSDAVFGIYQLS